MYLHKKSLFACCLLLIAYCLSPAASSAQNSPEKKHKIALFAPLYLDSAFNNHNEFRYTKSTLPSFINPGLEFYEGAQIALDSLALQGAPLDVFVYDTRSKTETLEQQLVKPELEDVELIIAHCSNNEIRILSDAALKKNVPVINATMPNDAGIQSNPFFVILNPTLRTQCEGIYEFVQKNFSKNPVIVFRKGGRADDMVKEIFEGYSKTTLLTPLKMKYVTLNDSFSVEQLTMHLDSTQHTVCLAGSLDINFGKRLAKQLAAASNRYHTTVIGMPTWDGIREFSKPEYKGTEIIYSTPFYNSRKDTLSQQITEFFNTQLYARPSDMVFRGYEVTWKFASLLLQYGSDLPSNLANKDNDVFTGYDIQPVINRNTFTLDYFENKKLYFIRWMDGVFKVN